MKELKEVIEHFGGQVAMAKALHVAPAAVSQWVSNDYMPPKRAIQIESLTKGKFKAIDLIKGYKL